MPLLLHRHVNRCHVIKPREIIIDNSERSVRFGLLTSISNGHKTKCWRRLNSGKLTSPSVGIKLVRNSWSDTCFVCNSASARALLTYCNSLRHSGLWQFNNEASWILPSARAFYMLLAPKVFASFITTFWKGVAGNKGLPNGQVAWLWKDSNPRHLSWNGMTSDRTMTKL